MLVNIKGIASEKVKQQSEITYSPNPELKDFPVLTMDRYSGITGLTIWSRLGEEVGTKSGCYSAYIGAFCPISNQVMFLVDVNHDYGAVSMSGQIPSLIPPIYKRRRKGSIIIQNDVWIGYGVTILGGVTIHNGAVVAANSTVTKDVPPYAIVAGNPARVIKYRFDSETIEKLQRIQWWYWDEKTIKERSEWFRRSPEEFAERFDVSAGEEHLPVFQKLGDVQLEGYSRESLFLVFSDMDYHFGILFKIIAEFSHTHTKDDCLVVVLQKQDNTEERIRQIYGFAENLESDCGLYIRHSEEHEIPGLISMCGTLITSRVKKLVQYTCLADLAGTKVISGVDVPIF